MDILTALVLREIKGMKPAPNRLYTLAKWLETSYYVRPEDRVELSKHTIKTLTYLALECVETTSAATFAVHSITQLVKCLNRQQVAELEEEIEGLYREFCK